MPSVNRLLKEKTQGIILLLTLLISFIIAFALSVELLNTRLNEKNVASSKQYNQLFYTVERKMHYLINNNAINIPQSCFVPASNPNDYPQKLTQKKLTACIQAIGTIILNYVIEDLGHNLLEKVHFYRITILGENQQKHQLVLQAVYALPENNTRKIISAERQSWRICPVYADK